MHKPLIALSAAALTFFLQSAFFQQSALAAHPPSAEDLPRFQQVTSSVFRGGQPSDEGLHQLKEKGIKTIVSLRCNRDVIAKEKATADELGINFVSIPMGGIHPPSDAKVKKFLSLLQDPNAAPVFVHCEQGEDRTGTMIALYRVDADKWTARDAYKEMVKDGFHKSYFWLTDSVFDYEQSKEGQSAHRPVFIKVFDSVESLLGVIKL